MNNLAVFNDHRTFLFSIAYRMLGTVMEAEDVLQEAYLRWQEIDIKTVEHPKAYLRAMVTRLCIDQLRSAQARREEYVGPWLPEPVLGDPVAPSAPSSPARALALSESLSVAFLVMLERLSPEQRAVFLLREVFDYGYDEIAGIIGKSEAATRQILSRARRTVKGERPPINGVQSHQRVVEQFVTALGNGDVDGVLALLAEDVETLSDGGGKAIAARRPITGAEQVLRFLLGLARLAPDNYRPHLTTINGKPGIINLFDKQVNSVVTLDVVDGKISRLWFVVNPDKLAHIQAQIDAGLLG